MCENSISAPADPAVQELPVLHPSKTESKLDQKEKIDFSENEVSQSVWESTQGEAGFDGQADKLERIMENCELYIFPPEVAGVFRNAVERLYYSSSFTLNGACLPQEKIRSHLWELNGCILQDALPSCGPTGKKRSKTVPPMSWRSSSTQYGKARATCWWTLSQFSGGSPREGGTLMFMTEYQSYLMECLTALRCARIDQLEWADGVQVLQHPSAGGKRY